MQHPYDSYRVQAHQEQLKRDAAKYRLVRAAQGDKTARLGTLMTIRPAVQRLWTLRWRVLPVVLKVSRPMDPTQTEELPMVPDLRVSAR